MPTLHDGRQVASDSPEWQLETLARYVLALKPLAKRRAWLEEFSKRNEKNPELTDKLRASILGNAEANKRQREVTKHVTSSAEK